MPNDLIICARRVKGATFVAEPGPSLFVSAPGDAVAHTPAMGRARSNVDPWMKELMKQAIWGKDSRTGAPRGDILVFVHGYNNDRAIVLRRQRRLRSDLAAAGYKGAVISFDWPSENMALNYVEDRHDAKMTAMQLVTDCISLLAERQTPDCCINVHLLGHSTGCLVIREAFDDADDTELRTASWLVSQIAFIGGDISAASMSEGSDSTQSLYRHCIRLTNYSNRMDSVLKLSNAKRVGISPRVGRIGLPGDAPDKAVDVDCSDYYRMLSTVNEVKQADQNEAIGSFDHSWHIGNRVFAADLFETLRGDFDRTQIPTRALRDGKLILTR